MDTILNTHYDAVFSGTSEEVRLFLLENPAVEYLVKLGNGQIVRGSDYLAAETA